jgi:RNA polymerase sigma factor (sigma-70 family)
VLSNQQIIEIYYDYILTTTKKMFNESLYQDVCNDISIRVMSMDNEKINGIHDRNEMRKYLYSIIRNEKINASSISNKQYRTSTYVFSESFAHDLSAINYDLNQIAPHLTPYELKLLVVYSQCKNFADMAKKYKIRRHTISREIKDIQTKIKKYVNLD